MTDSEHGDHLRELVSELKTRSPQEVMGSAAKSNLLGSVATAAVGLLTVLLLLTVLTFIVAGPPEARRKPADEPIAEVTATQNSIATTATAPSDADPADVADENPSSGEDPSDAVEALGIGDTKDADDPADALNNRLDDMLKGLE